MTTRTELLRRVQDELRLQPGLDSSSIEVAVGDGVVTLTGFVPTYAASCLADRAIKRVSGVECIVDELRLAPPATHRPTPEHTPEGLASALRRHTDGERAVGSTPGRGRVENGLEAADLASPPAG